MPKIREINQLPPEAEGSAEEQLAAQRDYLVKITQELYYLLTQLDKDAVNRLAAHLEDLSNPHHVTKAQVGLGNVANVLQYSADNKPTPGEIGAVPEERKINGYDLTTDRTLTAADVGAAPGKSVLRFTDVAVSAGTNQQIMSVSNEDITADHVLAVLRFASPSYISKGYSWDTTAGRFTVSGTATAATTAEVLLIRKGN